MKKFIIQLTTKNDDLHQNSKTETDLYSNLGDRMITYEMLFQFLISKELLNDIQDINSYDIRNNIFEEFCILAANFSNDEGSNLLSYGAVHEVIGESPDEIIENNIKNTALDRRRVEVDRCRKAPEWSPGYLQNAFVDVFLTGDADLYQQRPIPLTQKGTYRQRYLKQLAMLKPVQQHTQLLFTINNMLQRLDAFRGARCFLRDVDVTSVKIPSKEDLLNNTEEVTDISRFIMQYTPMTQDSKEYWKCQLQNEIGTKRDLEYMSEDRPDVKYPTWAAVFRTMAFPYTSAYYFHRLFSDKEEELANLTIRRSKVLVNSTAIEWVGSLLSELDLKYLAFYRYQHSFYVGRDEKGLNGNPHWHSLLYSKALGQLMWQLKENMEQVFQHNAEYIKQNKTSDIWSVDEIQTVKRAVHVAWLNARKQIIYFFKGQYTNWNPCYTNFSKVTGDYKQPDISTIRLSDLIDTALHTGDFSNINQLYCDIVSTHCRHIVHRGVNGLPAKSDYCYQEKKIKDKVHSVGGKVVTKTIVTCKRRKAQPMRGFPSICADLHDQKYHQLPYECNDEWFNGADPFMILNNLGNCDCKALIPSVFTRQPKYDFRGNDHNATMSMYMDVGDGAVEYVIKYTG